MIRRDWEKSWSLNFRTKNNPYNRKKKGVRNNVNNFINDACDISIGNYCYNSQWSYCMPTDNIGIRIVYTHGCIIG